MSYMLGEIEQQPEVISNILQENEADVEAICREIIKRDIHFILFAARGTSDNAAVFGKYLFGYINGIVVGLAASSLFTLYKKNFNLKNALVIGISQSGESPDVVEVLRQAKKQGTYCVAITNQKNSEITRNANISLYCHAGKEKSVPATKTYTGELALLYLLSLHLAGRKKELKELNKISYQMMEVISQKTYIKEKVEQYKYMNKCIVLGRGLNYATALETALKIKETSYLESEALSGADFLHGPIAIIDRSFPVIMIAPPDATFQSMLEITEKLKQKQAERIIMSSEEKILKLATLPITMPKMNTILTPITYIISGQLFAYYLCLKKGFNPDKPRGLNKITQTM
ncbi:MAG: SIS domain-containing protein [Elusimicrobia bacterium]|nr:SIS domain-containing protein [Elusimicrobiota bacterium]